MGTEPRPTALAAIVESLPREHRVLATQFIELFSDRPTAGSVDLVVMAQKLSIHFSECKLSREEFVQVYRLLERECRFRPTVQEVLAAIGRVRDDRRAAEFAARFEGAVEMETPDGYLELVPRDLIARVSELGYKPRLVTARPISTSKAIVNAFLEHHKGATE